MKRIAGALFCLCASVIAVRAQESKPLITLDEFMNATEVRAARVAPDGQAAVIWTNSPDWVHDRFRDDLWLWQQKTGTTVQLTQSGYDSSPAWSPDGKYIAFISSRSLADEETSAKEDDDKDSTERVWLISVAGGEALPLYTEKLDAHAFAWSADGAKIFFSVKQPLTKAQEDARKEEWKDVIRWREQERGDVLLAIPVQVAVAEIQKTPGPKASAKKEDEESSPVPSMGAALLGKMGWTAGEGLGAQGTGRTEAVVAELYSQGVGLGAEGGKLGDAAAEAQRQTKGSYAEFLSKTKDKVKERFERLG